MSDEPSTRERILSAAIEEFTEVGFAGARVDAIARKAGCNKQLLYHHFGGKEGLHCAVVQAVLAEKPLPTGDDLGELVEQGLASLDDGCDQRRWIRLLQWEALHHDGKVEVAEAERRRHLGALAERVRELQAVGVVRSDVSAEILLIQVMTLAMAPGLLPQLVTLLEGAPPDAGDFAERYRVALRTALRALLEPPSPT